jgi:putative ABC transport system permease protein
MVMSKELIKYSMKNLAHRKTRSFLTILSIFAGITTIFIFISFGWGLYDYVNNLSSSSSADKILIQAKGGTMGIGSGFKLTDKDLKAIQKTSGVYDATGVYVESVEITQGKIKRYSFLISLDPQKPLMLEFLNVKTSKGRMLVGKETGNAVLGANYQYDNKIMPKAYNLNENVELQGQKVKIIGFLQTIGNPQDDSQVYVSNDYLKKLYSENESYGMIIARVDISKIDIVIENIEKNLRKSRGLEKGKEDFFVQSFDELIKTYSSALNIVIGFVILIALISVLVSAVNTSNTMITSVLERVREIGIMKSIGARNSEIFSIFLFESGVLGFIAGCLGVLAGVGITYVAHLLLDFYGWSFLTPHYSISLYMGCIAFATITGAVSGVLPAANASRTNPVEALHYE